MGSAKLPAQGNTVRDTIRCTMRNRHHAPDTTKAAGKPQGSGGTHWSGHHGKSTAAQSCAHRRVAKELCCSPGSAKCAQLGAWMLSDPIASNRSCLQGLCLKRRLIGVIMGAQSALAVEVYKGKLK